MSKLMLTTRLDQRLLMNQQLKQAITLLQSSTIELTQQLQTALESNPLLEIKEEVEESDNEDDDYEDTNHYDNQTSSKKFVSDDDYLENIASKQSLRDFLMQQTLGCHFNENEQVIAETIIDAIDDNGYLTMSVEEICAAIPFTVTVLQIETILAIIQQFDPIGVGARSTQECLLLQLKNADVNDLAVQSAIQMIKDETLLNEAFDLKKLSKKMRISEKILSQALYVINSLEFHPGCEFKDERENSIEPELYVKKVKQQWQVFMTKSLMTQVDINHEYKTMIKKNARNKSYRSILNELNEAQFLINSIKRRNETLMRVSSYLIEKQQDFLNNGREYLRSMNMAEVALALELHESTISRITSGKFVATPHGVFELKFFFTSHVLMSSGEEKSSISVKSLIHSIISMESVEHAYSDDEIAKMLQEQNIHISRRTVAKYREALNIPSSYLRAGVQAMKSRLNVKSAAV